MAEGTEGKGSSGGRFRPPPATIWNNMIDAGRDFANRQLDQGVQPRVRPRATDLIKIRNDSGAARRRGEILRIDDSTIPLTDLMDEHIWLKGLEPTADGYFGILKDPAAIDSIEQLQVSGVCIALVDITDETHTHASAVATEYVLGSAGSGPLEILYAPDGTGEKECVVRFGGGSGGGLRIYFTVVDYLCVSDTETTLYVTAVYFTGGCTSTIPGEDSYGEITVIDPCGKALFFAATDLVGKSGFATYMYPREGYCTGEWLLDDLCGLPVCG